MSTKMQSFYIQFQDFSPVEIKINTHSFNKFTNQWVQDVQNVGHLIAAFKAISPHLLENIPIDCLYLFHGRIALDGTPMVDLDDDCYFPGSNPVNSLISRPLYPATSIDSIKRVASPLSPFIIQGSNQI